MWPADGRVDLPPALAKEIVRDYADILRVGRLQVNGEKITWQIGGSMEEQLQRFSFALFAAMRRAPESSMLREPMMQNSVYWLCRSFSINYILVEVLHTIRQRVGVLCTIEGSQDVEAAEFSLDILPGPTFRTGVTWSQPDNIVYRDPKTAERRVKGTLSKLDAEFPVPPDLGFAPMYSMHLEFKRSMASQILSTMACSDTCTDQKDKSSPTHLLVSPSMPLRSGIEDVGDPSLVCCSFTCELLGHWLPWFSGTRGSNG